jgi:hypothetical protein
MGIEMAWLSSIFRRLTRAGVAQPRPSMKGRAGASPLNSRWKIRDAVRSDLTNVGPLVERECALHQRWDPAKFGLTNDFAEHYLRWLRGCLKDPCGIFLVAATDGELGGFLVGTIDRAAPIYCVREFGFIRDLGLKRIVAFKG